MAQHEPHRGADVVEHDHDQEQGDVARAAEGVTVDGVVHLHGGLVERAQENHASNDQLESACVHGAHRVDKRAGLFISHTTQHGALALDHALEHTGVGLKGLHGDLNPLGIQRLGSGEALLNVLQLVPVLGAHLGHLRHLLQHLRVRRGLFNLVGVLSDLRVGHVGKHSVGLAHSIGLFAHHLRLLTQLGRRRQSRVGGRGSSSGSSSLVLLRLNAAATAATYITSRTRRKEALHFGNINMFLNKFDQIWLLND
mmetsp:Transcript_6906/g.11667  ORF Transcript_6906/g.11667 Transcript_6906/m.11667 type:complete len:254 (+) Transcript_6906:446-1207(+)